MLCAFSLLFCVLVHSDWWRIPMQSLHVCCWSGTHGWCFSSRKISRKARLLLWIHGKLLSRQSERDPPTTNFSKGIKDGKLMAKDCRGVLLVMFCVKEM